MFDSVEVLSCCVPRSCKTRTRPRGNRTRTAPRPGQKGNRTRTQREQTKTERQQHNRTAPPVDLTGLWPLRWGRSSGAKRAHQPGRVLRRPRGRMDARAYPSGSTLPSLEINLPASSVAPPVQKRVRKRESASPDAHTGANPWLERRFLQDPGTIFN